MINDKIINFITDNYKQYNTDYNINDYIDEPLFNVIHSSELYDAFNEIKQYIIKYYILHNKDIKKPYYFSKKYKDFIIFLIPNIDILNNCILYNYKLNNNELMQIYTKIFNDL